MPPPVHCCLLCGLPCTHPNCRYTPLAAIQALVRQRCVETAFHYAALLALPDAGRHMVCPTCINWRRRSRCRPYTRRRRWNRRVVYTPFDSMLMHALAPGFAEDPDRRCTARLCAALLHPGNGYAGLVPAGARAVLAAVCDGEAPLARAWWDANERTQFFRHPLTARLVRQMHRAEAAA